MKRKTKAEARAELEDRLRRSLAELERTFRAADRAITELPPIQWKPLPPLNKG